MWFLEAYPQGLKPFVNDNYGTAEAVPLTKRNAGFSTSLRFGRNDGMAVGA